jgi:hypothetical protein
MGIQAKARKAETEKPDVTLASVIFKKEPEPLVDVGEPPAVLTTNDTVPSSDVAGDTDGDDSDSKKSKNDKGRRRGKKRDSSSSSSDSDSDRKRRKSKKRAKSSSSESSSESSEDSDDGQRKRVRPKHGIVKIEPVVKAEPDENGDDSIED